MKRPATLKQIEHPLYGDNCRVYCYRGFQIWFDTLTARANVYRTPNTTKVDGSDKVANGYSLMLTSVEAAVDYIERNLQTQKLEPTSLPYAHAYSTNMSGYTISAYQMSFSRRFVFIVTTQGDDAELRRFSGRKAESTYNRAIEYVHNLIERDSQ